MSYIHVESGIYPYTKYMLRDSLPNVSFPADMTDESLAEFGVFPIVEAPKPDGDLVTELPPALVNGSYVQQWETRSFTAEEVAANLLEWREGCVVSMAQARLALFGAGMLAGVDAAIAALPEPDKTKASIQWEYATSVHRLHGWVESIGPSLGVTDAELDGLFQLAETL